MCVHLVKNYYLNKNMIEAKIKVGETFDRERMSGMFSSKEELIDYFNIIYKECIRLIETKEPYKEEDEDFLATYRMLITIGTNIFGIILTDYKKPQ